MYIVLLFLIFQCPNSTEINSFMNAAKRGDITWHAGPMNMQHEVMDVSLARFGMQLSKELDDKMNINRKFRTLSQRDVPGKILSNIFYLYILLFSPIVHHTNKTTPSDRNSNFLYFLSFIC